MKLIIDRRSFFLALGREEKERKGQGLLTHYLYPPLFFALVCSLAVVRGRPGGEELLGLPFVARTGESFSKPPEGLSETQYRTRYMDQASYIHLCAYKHRYINIYMYVYYCCSVNESFISPVCRLILLFTPFWDKKTHT